MDTPGAIQLREALQQLSDNALVEVMEGLETLLVYTKNLISFPDEKKYRKVKTSNIHYQERLGHLQGAGDAMNAIGYVESGDYLRLNEAKINKKGTIDELKYFEKLISTALSEAKCKFNSLPNRIGHNHVYISVEAAGAFSDQGKRQTMEDDEILIDGFCGDRTQGYFGLYDGHGGRGTVDFVVKALHMNLEQQLKRHPKQTIPEAYHKSYLSTDGQLRRKNILRSGTTSVSCLIRENKSIGGNGTDGNGGGKGSSNTNGGSRNGTGNSTRTLYTANVGDSRAVLVRNKKAIRLTKDHKASLPEEAKRITEAGGFIGRNRRVNGVLAISRALGDHMLKENDVVTAKPYCITTQLTDEDSFLILACDGVWDVMTDQEAADFVVEKVNNDIKHIDRMKLQPNGSMSNAFGHGDRHNGINLSQSNSNNNNGSKDMQNYTEVEQRKIKMNRILYNTCQALVKEALDRRSLDNVTVMIIKL